MAPKKRFLNLTKYPFMKIFLTKEWEVVEDEKGNPDTIYNASIEVVWPSFQTFLERNGYSENFCSKVLFGKLLNLCGIEKMRRGPRGRQKYFYYPIKPVKGSTTESLFIWTLHSTLSLRYFKLSDNVKKIIHEEVLQKKLTSIPCGNPSYVEVPTLTEIGEVTVRVLSPLEQSSNQNQSGADINNKTSRMDIASGELSSFDNSTNSVNDTKNTNTANDTFLTTESKTLPTCSYTPSESEHFNNGGLPCMQGMKTVENTEFPYYIPNPSYNNLANNEENIDIRNLESNSEASNYDTIFNRNSESMNNSFSSYLTFQNIFNFTKLLLDYQGGLNNMHRFNCHTSEPNNGTTESQLQVPENCDCDFCNWPN